MKKKVMIFVAVFILTIIVANVSAFRITTVLLQQSQEVVVHVINGIVATAGFRG